MSSMMLELLNFRREPDGKDSSSIAGVHRISVEEYDEMARVGVLRPEHRIELIEGVLIKKMTKNERHLTTTWLMEKVIRPLLPDGYFLVVESPLVLSRSEPEPDLMVLRGGVLDFAKAKPRPAQVPLVIEVADSSYAQDHARRVIYAEAGVAAYWIVNIPGRRIEVHGDPTGPDVSPDYRRREDYGRGGEVPLSVDGRELGRLAVDEIVFGVE